MAGLTIWLIGDSNHREFQDSVALLNSYAEVTSFASVMDVRVELEHAAQQQHKRQTNDNSNDTDKDQVDEIDFAPQELAFPELIILAQVLPGEITIEEVEQLRNLLPLPRIIGLLGSWCEGEFRSGNPWPAVQRIYWHHALPRLEQDLIRHQQGEMPSWNLPITVSHEEWLMHLQPRSTLQNKHQLIAVYSPHAESAKWMAEACEACGYQSVGFQAKSFQATSFQATAFQLAARNHQPPLHLGNVAAVLWDDNSPDLHQTQLKQVIAQFSPTPIIAVLTFPRYEIKQQLQQLGIHHILSKPLLINDLEWALEQVLKQTLQDTLLS